MQLALDVPAHIPADAYEYGKRASKETHGVVLTKEHIVELILDLAGYVPDRDLGELRLLEPACGHGAFLEPVAERLLKSAKAHGHSFAKLREAVVAYDIDENHVERSRQSVAKILRHYGATSDQAKTIAERWVRLGDYLLTRLSRKFDFAVGNPPYIRIEQLSADLQREYRTRFSTLSDRADLYVAFIEKSLHLLTPSGLLSFICADRWTLNKYGGALRRMLTDRFQVRYYIDLHQTSPFFSEVTAYPAIFVIGRGRTNGVRVARLASASPEECRSAYSALSGSTKTSSDVQMSVYSTWFRGDEPWILKSPAHLDALRDLESRFDSVEADGVTRVGIGVATGSDRIYIVDRNVDIEPDRLVPIVMRSDLQAGTICNSGRFVINAFYDKGRGVVDLQKYPRLARYLMANAADIKKRHVARKNPGSWFRTIDRVYPELVKTPKLLIPDISGANEIVYDEGKYYPHHNLYYITSAAWDLEVLGGLLSSKVALFFVWCYSTKMRGGYLRFQAQYLRRIRLPSPRDLPKRLANSIRAAYRRRDFSKLDDLALIAYGSPDLPKFDFVDTRK